MENSIDFMQILLTVVKVIFDPFLFIILVVAAAFFIKKSGFGGVFFSGKSRNKIYEYAYKNNYYEKKIFVYKLIGKAGYEGYGVEFIKSKSSAGLGSFRMQGGGSFIEFTKKEAEMIVKLVSPHIEKGVSIGA